MVAVPSNLTGATTLDAHQWVVGLLDGQADYKLMSGGAPVTLSDITKGTVADIEIKPLGSRVNPAGSYAFKPSHQPQKFSKQFSSRVVTPEGLSPSLVQSMESAHGTHAAIHMLSKMLSQRSLNMPLSPKGIESLSSFILADPAPVVRRNPIGLRQTPTGLRMTRVIGERGRVMDDMMLKEVMGYLQKNDGNYELPTDFPATEKQFQSFKNNVLQPYLISVEANRTLIKYLNDVLIPHMNQLVDDGAYSKKGLGEAGGVTMTKAKIKQMIARRYDTIVSRLATSCQDFYMGRNEALIAHPAFLYPQMQYVLLPPPLKLTGGSRAEVFLYQAGEPPKYGKAVDDPTTIAQHMPRHMMAAIKAQQEGAEELTFPVARINNRPIDFANIIHTDVIGRSLRAGNIAEILVTAGRWWSSTATKVSNFFRRKGTTTTANPLTEEQNNVLRDLNKVANDVQSAGANFIPAMLSHIEEGSATLEKLPIAAVIEVNIGGLKPRPIRWPESLICCMMQVLSDNADQIMRTDRAGGEDSADEVIKRKNKFFQPNLNLLPPSIESNIKLEYLDKNGKSKNKQNHSPHGSSGKYQHLDNEVKGHVENFFNFGLTLNDLVGNDKKAYAATIALDMATNVNKGDRHHSAVSADIYPTNNNSKADGTGGRDRAFAAFKALPTNPTKDGGVDGDARAVKFLHIVGERSKDYGLGGSTPKRLSILHIMQLAITNCKTNGHEPTPEEVKFVTHLLMYCIAKLDTDVTTFMDEKETGPITALTKALELREARQQKDIKAKQRELLENINEAIQGVNAVGEGDLGDVFQQLVVNQLLADAFGGALEGGDLMGALGIDILEAEQPVQPAVAIEDEVMENPGHGMALDSLSEQLKDSPLDRAVIRQVKDNIDASNAQIIARYGTALPGQDVVNALAEQLRGVFAEAVRQTNEERQEAQELAAANLRIARLLDRETIEDAEQDAMEGFLELIRNVQSVTSSLLRSEESFVNDFGRFLPLDPFNARDDEYYSLYALEASYKLLVGQIESTENTARSALSAIRMFTKDESTLSANEPRINYLAQLIQFCNAMQSAYGEVGGLLNQAMEDMADDEGGISPYIYRAAFNTADNFNLRSMARIKLRTAANAAATSVDPYAVKATFFKLYENCLDVIGKLFGAFPSESEMPSILGTRTGYRVPGLKFADDYLVRLIDAGLDFGGDSSHDARRDAIFIEMVSPSEAARRRLEQHKENVAEARRIQEEQKQKALKLAKDQLLGSPSFSTRNMAKASQMFVDLDIAKEAERKATQSKRVIGDMFEQTMRHHKGQKFIKEERARAEAQKAYDKEMSMKLFHTALRTPGSDVRDKLMQQKLEMPAEDYVEPVTPEDQAYQLHVIANGIALNTLRALGPKNGGLTEKMYQRAIKGKLPKESILNIKKGLEAGRAKKAEARYQSALLKAVQDAVAIEKPTFATPEEIANDEYVRYMMNVSEQDLAMRNSGASLPALDRIHEVDHSANKFGMRMSDYGAGTGDYALFNPSTALDVYNARGEWIGEVSPQKAVTIIDRHGYIKRGHAIYPGNYDATQELLAEMRGLVKATDEHHSQYDSKPFQRGGGFLPSFGAHQTVPVSDTRARDVSKAGAVYWSEGGSSTGSKSPSPEMTKPLTREDFARSNGGGVVWYD